MQNDLGKWKGKLLKVFWLSKFMKRVSQKWPWNSRNFDIAVGSDLAD